VGGGGGPYGYQWHFNETNALAGERNATLVLANVLPAQFGNYTVVVTNSLGGVTSAVATVSWVWGDCDGDGLSDEWELAHGLKANDPHDRDGDADQDGKSNYEEYLSGTDPADAVSHLKIESIACDGGDPTGWLLRFNAVSNRTYSLLCAESLGSQAWSNWVSFDARPTNAVITATNRGSGASSRFYRLVTPRMD
jgi:hypothetical protein